MPIDPATVTVTSFTLVAGATPVSGTVSYSGTTASFTPSSALATNTSHTARLTTAIRALGGAALASDYVWQFTTGADADATVPTVTSTSPAASATGVAVNGAISASFSEPLNASTVTAISFTLKQGANSVTGSVSYSADIATFTPAANLAFSTPYTATLTTAVKDLAGNALASNVTWSFTTGAASDATAPTVTSTSPASTATGVAVNSAISASFSETLSAGTVTATSFTLKQGTTSVPGTVSYSGTTATFTPTANLAFSTAYTATLTPVIKDLAGNALAADFAWSFTTMANPDVTPPAVTSTFPASGATGVVTNSTVSATFSEAMSAASLTTATFSLSGPSGAVAGAVSSSGNVAVFTPSVPLSAGTTYTATLSAGGPRDLADNALVASFSWSFTTGATGWTTRQFGSAGSDEGLGVASDSSGNVYVTGYISGSLDGNPFGGAYDAFVVKYNSSGVKQWSREIGTAGQDAAYGVATDAAGNVFITGYTYGGIDGNTFIGFHDAFLTKYDTNGNKLWTRQFGTTGADQGARVVTDAAGNVYVGGYTTGGLDGNINRGGNDLFIVKYDTNGTRQLTIQHGGSGEDVLQAITVDSSGSLYVAGYETGSLDGFANAGLSDAFVVKFNSTGVRQWTRQFGTTSDDNAVSVKADAAGNVYVAGNASGGLDGNVGAGGLDLVLVKFDANGTRLWTQQLGSAGYDAAMDSATDAAGNTYMTGWVAAGIDGNTFQGGARDIVVVKYDASGVKQWTRQYGTTSDDMGRGIALDGSGFLYVSGSTTGGLDGNANAGGMDVFVIKLDTNGNKQ